MTTTYIQYKTFSNIQSLNEWLKDFQYRPFSTEKNPIYRCVKDGQMLQLCGVQFLGSGQSSGGEEDFAFEMSFYSVAQYIVVSEE